MNYFIQQHLVITLAIAILGAALGVINTYQNILRARRETKIDIQVKPVLGYRVGDRLITSSDQVPEGKSFLVINIINRGHSNVFIENIYLLASPMPKGELCLLDPAPTIRGRELPCKLERNQSVTFQAEGTTVDVLQQMKIAGVYIKTQCGNKCSGTSEVLKRIHSSQPA